MKISELKLWNKNPRGITKEDFETLKKRLTEKGQFKPLLINQDNIVLGGNMRLRAMRELGWSEADVTVVQTKDEKEMTWYALVDNEKSGYYEDEKLAELAIDMPELEDIKVDLGKSVQLGDLMDKFRPVEEDEVPEVEEGEPISKLGEVYQLGRRRLMCGDATKREDVEKLMNGKKADMVFTDPPYGVDYEGKTKDKLKIENDTTTDIWADVLPNYIAVSKMGASYYVCCPAGNNFIDFLQPFSEHCYQSSTIIWVKNTLVMGHGDYHYQHEPILYGWVKGASHQFYGDRTNTTLWNIDRPTSSKEHPTMKPIALVSKAVKNSSKQDDIVLDLFGGSGSTLIACEQLDRTCYTMEIDPKYCDVIRKRYENYVKK